MIRRRTLLAGGGAAAVAALGAGYWSLRQMGTMDAYAAAAAASRTALSENPALAELVRYATLAANGHNTQPWRFRIATRQIDILPDPTRRTPVVDPDDHHLFASLGCAVENLAIAAAARGHPTAGIGFDAADGTVRFAFGDGPATPSDLFQAIPVRQSTRAEYDGRPVPAGDLRALATAAAMPGVDLVLITERAQMDRVRDLVIAGNSAQMADPAFVRELKGWVRFSPRQAMAAGDGLFGPASGNPALPEWVGRGLFDLVFRIGTENDKYARQMRSSAGVAVFIAERDDADHWVRAGRACQRFALQATALGLKTAFVNQPVEVASLRPELATLAGLPGRRPDLVLRFGYGPTLPYAPRRPVAAVLV